MTSIDKFSCAARLLTTASALFVLCVSPAFAQLEAQQGAANPGRVGEQIRTPVLPRAVTPAMDIRSDDSQAAPAGSEKITFTLRDIQIDGVSVYSPDALRAFYAGRIGQTISLADVYGIASAITRQFRNDGYILTQVVVPPQTIDGGVARLQVVEGYIDQVTVRMEDGGKMESERSMKLVRQTAERITTGAALNMRDIERYMLLINDLPGVVARGVLSPSRNKPGAADLGILISRDQVEGLVGLDNYGTRYLGPVQASGAIAFNNIIGFNERLSAQTVIAPEPGNGFELGYFALGYEKALNSRGLKLDVTGNYTATNPGYTLDNFDVRGYSRYIRAALSYPFIRSRKTNLYTNVAFDMRNVNTSNDFENTRKDRIRALRAGGRFENLDTFFGAGLNSIDIELAQGLDLFGATDRGDVDKSRAEGEGVFTKLNIEAQRLQRLADNWNLLVGAKGQLSNDALLSSEEFGIGGFGFARGYDPSEIIGDEGIAGKVEVQWNIAGPFSFTHDNQIFGFYEGGRVWNDDPAAPNLKTDTLASAGLGVRSKIMDYTNVDMTLAFPLNRDVQTQKDEDPRFYFSLSRKF